MIELVTTNRGHTPKYWGLIQMVSADGDHLLRHCHPKGGVVLKKHIKMFVERIKNMTVYVIRRETL